MKKSNLLVILIMLVFFVVSFLTNILGALNQKVSESFTLTETMAGLLPFAFFIAYGIMSIPFGFLVEKYGEKKIMIVAFLFAFLGSLVFAFIPVFSVFIVSLFSIGAGMAALQVVINPLLRVSGGEDNYAFNSVMAQLFFGLASFISPQMYSYFVINIDKGNVDKPLIGLMSGLVPATMSWVSVYWAFAAIAIVMGFIIFLVKFPTVELQEDEKVGSKDSFMELIKNKYVILYFLGIFMYVGSEQGISYWLSKFLKIYHNIDPDLAGADAVSYFWGLMTVGGMLGLILMKLFDSKQILRWFTFFAIICVAAGLFGSADVALWALPVSGFFLSVMYPTVVSLGLNSVDKHHGSFAGILMTGIAGGAIVQVLIGAISDVLSLRAGMLLIFITLGYIFSISFWAKPLISNATIKLSAKNRQMQD